MVLLQVGHRKEAAAVAHVYPVCITLVEQPLLHSTTSTSHVRLPAPHQPSMWIRAQYLGFTQKHQAHRPAFSNAMAQERSVSSPCISTQTLKTRVPWMDEKDASTGLQRENMNTVQQEQAQEQGLRTLRNAAEPWEMMQSRSISPKRRPPSRARPSTGCRVRICTGPRPRECILSSTCVERHPIVQRDRHTVAPSQRQPQLAPPCRTGLAP